MFLDLWNMQKYKYIRCRHVCGRIELLNNGQTSIAIGLDPEAWTPVKNADIT